VAHAGGELEVVARTTAAREGEQVAVRPSAEGPPACIWRAGGVEDAA
jgi:hypothetical protein